MSSSRNEIKVGIFVLVGLVLLGLLMLQFAKGTTSFRKTYEIHMKATNIGGLRKNSAILVSGVQVGTVSDIRLSEDAKTVTVILKIFNNFKIHSDARFIIEQSGFLGDQYVAIIPTENKLAVLAPRSEVTAEEPFNLQEAARSAVGFLQRADESVKKINTMIEELGKHVLSERTLTNVAEMVKDLKRLSQEALVTVDNINALVQTNSPLVSQSLTNLSSFAAQLRETGESVDLLIESNRTQIASAVRNIESATVTLTNLLAEAQSGKGVAGALLKNERMSSDMEQILHNVSITTSNLNKLGLWRLLWKPREAKSAATNQPQSDVLHAPKDSPR